MGFPGGLDGKVSTFNVGDPSSIPRSGRSPGAENGNPLQYSWLENPMDRRARQATVHGVTKVWHILATKPAPYIKYIANENLLYSIRNYTQYLVITYSVKEFEKEYIHMCVCMCVHV